MSTAISPERIALPTLAPRPLASSLRWHRAAVSRDSASVLARQMTVRRPAIHRRIGLIPASGLNGNVVKPIIGRLDR